MVGNYFELCHIDSENETEDGGEVEEAESDDSSADTDTDTELSDEEGSDRDAVDENFINSVKSALGNGAAGTSDEVSCNISLL